MSWRTASAWQFERQEQRGASLQPDPIRQLRKRVLRYLLFLYVYSPALNAVFYFPSSLISSALYAVLFSDFVHCRRIVSGILLLFSRMPSEDLFTLSHFHTSVWLHPLPISVYLCLSLPISAYLGLKWPISANKFAYVKKKLYLCSVFV